MTQLALVPKRTFADLAEIAVATIPSHVSRLSYRGYLKRFMLFCQQNHLKINRETIGAYLAQVRNSGASNSVIRQNIKAIRVLAKECRMRNLLTRNEHENILAIKSPRVASSRAGNWLRLEDVQQLLKLPDRSTAKGLQDAVVVGLLVGCGLRRNEAAQTTWERYQQREGRWCLVDFLGKGAKTRTVPVPDWLAADMNAWKKYHKSHRITGGISTVGVWIIVNKYMKLLAEMPGHEHCGNITPHDLRRTLAKLMHDSGVSWDQISSTLGHADLKTTMSYVNAGIELKQGSAGVDLVQMVAPKVNESLEDCNAKD